MIIALAFASPFQIKQHSLFPEVIHIDATANASKVLCPLLTLTAKDFSCKFVTIQSCMANHGLSSSSLLKHFQNPLGHPLWLVQIV